RHPLRALAPGAGRRRGRRRDERAGQAQRALRAALRLPVRRLGERAHEGRDRDGPARTPDARSRARARGRGRGISRDRRRPAPRAPMTGTEISYGKAHVVFYRLGGRDLAPLAASVDVDVTGERFPRAYTEGDHRAVVSPATRTRAFPSSWIARSRSISMRGGGTPTCATASARGSVSWDRARSATRSSGPSTSSTAARSSTSCTRWAVAFLPLTLSSRRSS